MRFPLPVPGFEIFDLPGSWFGYWFGYWVNHEVQALLLVRPGSSWFDQELPGLTKNFLVGQEFLILRYEIFVRKPSS